MITWRRRLRGFMQRTMPGMITCGQFEAALIGYLEGTLPVWTRWAVSLHIAMCPECHAYLKAYRTTLALGRTAFDDAEAPVPDDVPEDLVEAILTHVDLDRVK